ncbi:deoxyxylulose-5-phosphate synthase [Streptacidiphilus griseoplanus]|uniref:deoxyxylulose-5-phosphate synthase n=1 Tax=Peterkaempfera griseoplana TaxID=66896 RepID=UPI001FDFED63|nr:deoxyxylulose-5-phosphate synthase [Peterkaempfera griseoplana]
MPHGKTSYVCLPCRASYKQPYLGDHTRLCPRCAKPLIHAGSAFAAPRRRDDSSWRVLSVLLHAGVRFHKSCCGGPGYRPRTLSDLRQRMAHARTSGEPFATALVHGTHPTALGAGRAGRAPATPRPARKPS